MTDYDVGIRPFPSIKGKPPVIPAALGSAWFVSAKIEHPDEVALLLDYLFSEEAVKIWVETGGSIPPVTFEPTDWNLSPLIAFAIDTAQGVGAGNTNFGSSIDPVAPPEFNDAAQSGFQAVLAGSLTPEQLPGKLQEASDEGHET